MMRAYYRLCCWLGRPVCYQKFPGTGETDWWFAMCKACDRQAEVHERFRGPVPRTVRDTPPDDIA